MKKLTENLIRKILPLTFFVFLFLFFETPVASAGLIENWWNGMWYAGGVVLDTTFAPFAYLAWGLSLGIGGLATGFGGLMLDMSFEHTILRMGSYLNATSGLGGGIFELWSVMRDILNILFIFGLIHVGIKTILDAHNSETHRILGRLIVAALLVNFSLFITQVVIDFTNILSVQIYNQIVASELTQSFGNGPKELGLEVDSRSIAGAFLQLTGITTFFGGDAVTAKMTNVQSLVFAMFTLVFLITAGLVFGLAAFLLISRFVALIIFMILSPIMFAGWVFPAFEEQQNEWWNKFIHYALFPPALLLMIYLSLMVLNKMRNIFILQNAGFTGAMTGAGMTSETITLIMFFCIAFGFLYASIKIANSMGIAGAETSLHVFSEARGMAQGFMYRNTAGLGLEKLTDLIDYANRTEGKGNTMAKMSKFGLRVVTGGEQGRATIKKAANYGAGGHGREHMEHDEHERKKRAARSNQIHNIEHALDHGTPIEKEKAMRDASSAQLIEMIEHHQEKFIINNAGLLSDSQMAAIMKDDKIDDATKGKIAGKRSEQTQARLITDNPTTSAGVAVTSVNQVIEKADTSDLKAIGFDTLMKNTDVNGAPIEPIAGKLTAKQIDDWKDLTPTEKNKLKEERKRQLNVEFNAGAGAAALFGRISSDEERSKLPGTILTHLDSAQYINTNVLRKIADNNGISAAERASIKNTLLTRTYPPGHVEHDKYDRFFQTGAGLTY